MKAYTYQMVFADSGEPLGQPYISTHEPLTNEAITRSIVVNELELPVIINPHEVDRALEAWRESLAERKAEKITALKAQLAKLEGENV